MAERVQSYLDGHKIGRLFENLMSSVIKDMPNEPIQYLIRLLQKIDQRMRSPTHALDKKTSGSTPLLHKYGLGLSGHPAPTRSGGEPHVLLPGGKSVAASWGSGDFGGTKHPARPSSADPKRGYSKPWLSGGESKQTAKPATSKFKQDRSKKPEKIFLGKEKSGWHADNKTPTKSKDKSSEFQRDITEKVSQPLLPKNTDKVKLPIDYEGVKTWSAGTENHPSGSVISEGSMVSYYSSQRDKGIEDIGIQIAKTDKMEVDSDRGEVRSNKKAKHKANEQKRRLEALLKEKDFKKEDTVGDKDSEDEAIEIMESTDDLQGEGVVHPVSCGVKLSKNYKPSDSGSNVQIKICARCAKVMSTGQLGKFSETYSDFRPMPKSAFSDVIASDDDFESVSQVGIDGARKTVSWPVISDSEEDTYGFKANPRGKLPLEQKHMYKGKTQHSMFPDKKGDFFEANAPTRPLQTASLPKTRYLSDLESDVSDKNFPVGSRNPQLTGGKAWSFKAPDTGSEADSDGLFGKGHHV